MNTITIEATIKSTPERVWELWNDPKSITQWAFASDDWECPYAENDVRVGGKFLTRMSAKDKSAAFDFTGTYTEVLPQQKLAYTMDDGRKVTVTFDDLGNSVHVVETFEPERENPAEMQRSGWQAMLNNFKKWAERV